ncbi:uncharacterized protein I206_106143 [Kwoniella pini CBS 10737]|uniref:R3H-associated N-terminal domain-containing protein n=1 Tax=Kwoniella pini CBS 10737 TaxID=1296096 RepID=A0A1B9I169_9TREE|nr:uncharacterized protein I206_04968 [Kwoniella pini CBS 10737]OCF49279.1 hypothetical protein I206_04968 [Kwoniella pini CBS 10737]
MSTIDPSAPAPLRLPAILQNPTNTSQRQIESYNSQQREKLQARREAKLAPRVDNKLNGKGKRVIRRLDNAAFASNPHIAPPLKSDYYPSVPLQSRSKPPAYFDGDTIPRKQSIPSTILPPKGLNSHDSVNGNFNLSLKGTRQLLRKRGKRVEGLINTVEGELRNWLSGEGWNISTSNINDLREGPSWKIIDNILIDLSLFEQSINTSTITNNGQIGNSNRPGRRLPPQHQIIGLLPSLPKVNDKEIPSIMEISRSPVHLSWYIVDSFERLVIHILVRYYELVSWSETHQTLSGESIRLTNIIVPTIIKPRINISNQLITPETSELSSLSGPDSTGSFTASELDSDTATERGGDDNEEEEEEEIGYNLEGDTTITSLPEEFSQNLIINNQVELERTISNTSSAYASSEGGTSDYSLLEDSLILPPAPNRISNLNMNSKIPPDDEWSDFGSDLGDLPPIISNSNLSRPDRFLSNGLKSIENGNGNYNLNRRKGWEDKPTFFEYLYGA